MIIRTEREGDPAEVKDSLQEKWNTPQGVIWDVKAWEHIEGMRLLCHNELVIAPGESFEAWIPINVLQNNNAVGEFGSALDSDWLPGYGLYKPGKYQIFVRYWDTSDGWPESSKLDKFLTADGAAMLKQQRLERVERLGEHVGIPSPITLGPFEVEISALPAKHGITEEQVTSFASMLTRWNKHASYREPITDYVRGFKATDIAELPEILQGGMLDSIVGDTLAFTAIRHHFSIEREEGKPAKFVPLKLEDIDRLLDRLMQDDPLRTHVILSKCIWLHKHGKRQEAIDLADSIRATNPDAEVFWHLAQYGKWTERKRQRPQ